MKQKYILSMLLLCCLGTTAWAGGFKIGLQGQKQIGMGHTGIGFAQDAATIYFNPAGMSFVKSQLNGSVNLLFPSTSFLQKGSGQVINAVNQAFTPFSLYGQVKLSKHLNFGLGVYTPFGSGMMYPSGWTGRYILNRIDLQSVYIQPTLSIRLAERFSIGGGFVFSQGNMLLQKDIPLQNANGQVANAELNGKANGIGYNLGAYYKGCRLGLGAVYHSKVNMKVHNGLATFNNIPQAAASSFPLDNTFTTSLPLPSELGFGLSYKLHEKFVVAIDYNYTFWKSFDSLGFDYKYNTASLTDAKSPRLYENASAIRIGAQWRVCDDIALRAGAFYDQTPIKDGYVNPELPDNNKTGITAGFSGRLSNRFSVDLSALYESVKERAQTNIETGLDGTFKTKALSVGFGLNYKLHGCSCKSCCNKKKY
ncbi:MAG: outer membrane protein transport protein [Chitinophagaceae bacterium]